MSLWKVGSNGISQTKETKLNKESYLEENLEDWITQNPSLLGEPLLILGHQVRVPDINDRMDILALDPQGNAVIIELKIGHLKDPVDMQSLKYASYVSKWGFEDFERELSNFKNKTGEWEFNFNKEYEDFCSDAGVEGIPDINQEQRIFLVGSGVGDKLGSVTLWLNQNNIDIKVLEIEAYQENDEIFIQPEQVVPEPHPKFFDVGKIDQKEGAKPWKQDGKSWHLDKRCSSLTKEMFLTLNEIISGKLNVSEPSWSQKLYVSYKIDNINWLIINTKATALKLRFLVKPGSLDKDEIPSELDVAKFKKELSLSEKLNLPSSVNVESKSENWDKVILRIKKDFDFEDKSFLKFLKEAYASY